MSKIIEKTWNHKSKEKALYDEWEKKGYFKPEVNNDRKGKSFVISMPPPNVTGKLHIGHSLFISLEDLMTRYHRLLGERSLWVLGTDHAGIATQTVVDKALRKKGINRHDLGRDKFVEKVWEWKEEYGGIITEQLRRMGASCDWSRERFTLDAGLSKAVNEAFSHLYNKGLIYRGEYIVNWCPKCGTAIADDEVEHEKQKGKLYYFKYDKDFPITIATTRPETKLGDTAVAVNPKDERYKEFVGKEYDVDLDGTKLKIKIIADRTVDSDYGTGAVGVTPAHSAVDWKMAEAHGLNKIKIIDELGKMTEKAGNQYKGMKAVEAREKMVKYLDDAGLIEKIEEIDNSLSVCYRCGGAIEPIPSLQWFVKMKPLAEKAKKAVKDGDVEIIPKRFEKVYFHWMDNIEDWCISRQLWWGHRIPVYYRKQEMTNDQSSISNENCGLKVENSNIYVGENPPKGWKQDEDVLDTWFSSALWPFSTLGWPDKTKDLDEFYPTTVMETGYDILFFWVARMIMMGLELTGEVPFKTVYLHGLVRDEQNRKMSKSLGNALDPLDLIDKYGTDALRMALLVGSTPGQDVAVGESKIKGYRNFSNKIWNASRFVALRVSEGDLRSGEIGEKKIDDLSFDQELLTEADKKILKKHRETVKKVSEHIEKFRFSLAGETIYHYFWDEFCDKYIEQTKNQLEDEKLAENTKKILIKILTESLVMLHPFVPFVTEAVWLDLREIYDDLGKSIMKSNWPNA